MTLPLIVGNTEAIAGLITPFCLPKIVIALINVAPVEPAENTASTFFLLTAACSQ